MPLCTNATCVSKHRMLGKKMAVNKHSTNKFIKSRIKGYCFMVSVTELINTKFDQHSRFPNQKKLYCNPNKIPISLKILSKDK